jgi:hypothetical protein
MPGTHRLFVVTQWLIKAAIVFSVFITALLILSLGAIVVVGTHFSAAQLGMPADLAAVDRFKLLAIAAFAIGCGAGCFVLVFLALRATAEIIETATSGDPFVEENAQRLMHIGWLLLAIEVIGFFADPVFNYLTAHLVTANLARQANLHFGGFGFGMSPIGLLAVLLIFVLAQIFRRGSEMRAELQETV